MESLSDRLRRTRNAVRPKLSQAKVAKHFGIAPSSVAQWEIGRSKPDLDKLPGLARLYGVSLTELCGDDVRLFDVPSSDHRPPLKREDEIAQEIRNQLFFLERVWQQLDRGERRGLIAAVRAFIEGRKSA